VCRCRGGGASLTQRGSHVLRAPTTCVQSRIAPLPARHALSCVCTRTVCGACRPAQWPLVGRAERGRRSAIPAVLCACAVRERSHARRRSLWGWITHCATRAPRLCTSAPSVLRDAAWPGASAAEHVRLGEQLYAASLKHQLQAWRRPAECRTRAEHPAKHSTACLSDGCRRTGCRPLVGVPAQLHNRVATSLHNEGPLGLGAPGVVATRCGRQQSGAHRHGLATHALCTSRLLLLHRL